MVLLDGLVTWSKICNISKFTIWLMRLIILSLVLIHNLAWSKVILILNLLLNTRLLDVLAGIHSVCHINPCTWQKACGLGFVHLLLILTSWIFLRLLSSWLLRELTMPLINHLRMSKETVRASILRVWVAIAWRSHVDVFFVVELIVIQIWIFVVLQIMNYLWLHGMVHWLDHLRVWDILVWLFRKEGLCESLVFWNDAICSTCTVSFIDL